jgi:hypothetical protein
LAERVRLAGPYPEGKQKNLRNEGETQMKALKTMTLALSAAVVLGANGLYAQLRTVAVANIPFEFTVQSMTLPAGEYALERESSASDLIRVKNINTRHAAYVLAPRTLAKYKGSNNEKGTLLFHRYGDRYFFSEIWTPNGGMCGGVSPSKLERELQASDNQTRMALVSISLEGAGQ